jgi:hypothetical protein
MNVCSNKNVGLDVNSVRVVSMFSVDSIDTITEGSTLLSHGHTKTKGVVSYAAAVQDGSDDLSNRMYDDPSMAGRWTGHMDSKNKRLTVRQKHVHHVGHSNERSRNEGQHRRMMGMDKLLGKTKTMRADTVANTQPVGCNGPVICKLGIAMRGVLTQHDSSAPVHAAPHMQFSHGGIATEKAGGDVSMIGAGGTVPADTPNNASLNSAAGLHYAMKVGPASAYTDMQKQNFMQGIATGAGV